jgi:hypothetical protein
MGQPNKDKGMITALYCRLSNDDAMQGDVLLPFFAHSPPFNDISKPFISCGFAPFCRSFVSAHICTVFCLNV